MQASAGRPAATGSLARLSPWLENSTLPGSRWFRRQEATPSAGRMPPPLVYGACGSGRLASYRRVLERLFGARPAGRRDVLFSRAPVLILAAEDHLLFYALAGLLRALAGRRTVGLVLRPTLLAASGGGRLRWKGRVLGRLKRVGAIRTLAVLPFRVLPALAAIADGWIYDVQLFDLTGEEHAAVDVLRGERRPGDRLVMTAIGAQHPRKGFDLFCRSYARFAALRARFRFIACGRVAGRMEAHAALLREAGGVAVDRVVSDAELLGAYAASDAVWCLYPPAGDHVCGIFGRAVQLGLPVVVRRGSIGHRLCRMENLRHVAATADDLAVQLASPLPVRDAEGGRLAALRFARQSEAALRDALGLVRNDD